MRREYASLVIVVMGALLLVLSARVPPAKAASTTVILPIDCTVAESGAPSSSSFTVGVSSGTANPSSITCEAGGFTTPVNVTSGVTVTVTVPTAGTTTQYQFLVSGSASATVQVQACSKAGTTCDISSITAYYQVLEQFAYSIVGSGSGYSPPSLSYTSLGSTSTYTETTTLAAGWLDYGSTWSTTNPLTGSTSSERWAASPTETSGTASAGAYVITSYYNQFGIDVSYSVIDGGSPIVSLSYTQFDSSSTSLLGTASTLVWVDSGRTYSVPATISGGSGEQWAAETEIYTATASTVTNFAYYHQYEHSLSYVITDGGSGYSPPTAAGSQFGSSYAPGLTTTPTDYWFDATGSITFTNPLGGSNPSERWETETPFVSAESSSDTVVNYFNQYLAVLSYSVSGGGTPAAPTFSSTEFGSSYAPILTTSATDYWLDNGASWSLTHPLGGSGSTERWETSGPTSGTVSSYFTTLFTYYHQYYIEFSYSVSGGGSGYSAPALTYTSLGGKVQATLVTTGNQYWIDVGSSWSASLLGGSSASERWSAQSSTGTVASQTPVVLSYFHQYLITDSYSLVGGGTGFTPPSLAFQSYGSPSSVEIGESPASVWADAGSSWSLDNPLSGSSSSERWQTNATTAGSVLSPLYLSLTFYHQYQVTFGYSVLGGGTGYSLPSVQIFQFGTQIFAGNLSGWADAGSRYSFTNPLNGSSASQRWYTGSGDGTIQSSSTINATYYHQYDFILSYGVVGSTVQHSAPNLNSTALGYKISEQLQTSPEDYWLDSGSHWTVSTLLQGSGSTERWMTNQTTSGTTISSTTVEFVYYHQYLGHFAYTVIDGGSPAPPSLTFVEFGAIQKSSLSTRPDSLWIDSSTNWLLPLLLPGSNSAERWIANATATGSMSGALNVTLPYLHQYYLHTGTNSELGGVTANATQWYNRGTTISLNATASPGWRFEYWKGTGSGAYNGTEESLTVALDGPANETAVYYPGLTISTGSTGYITYTYGAVSGNVSAGSTQVVYVPIGSNVSLKATPTSFTTIFSGWSGNLAGSAQKSSIIVGIPSKVSASFQLDLADISVTVVVIPVVVVLAVYILAIRRWPRETN